MSTGPIPSDDDDGEDVGPHEALTFDQLCASLRRWEGTAVGITAQGHPEGGGNTTLHVEGVLRHPEDGEAGLIDSRGGRIDAFRVGDGGFQMVEGDFVEADSWDFDDELVICATFREIALNFAGPKPQL